MELNSIVDDVPEEMIDDGVSTIFGNDDETEVSAPEENEIDDDQTAVIPSETDDESTSQEIPPESQTEQPVTAENSESKE